MAIVGAACRSKRKRRRSGLVGGREMGTRHLSALRSQIAIEIPMRDCLKDSCRRKRNRPMGALTLRRLLLTRWGEKPFSPTRLRASRSQWPEMENLARQASKCGKYRASQRIDMREDRISGALSTSRICMKQRNRPLPVLRGLWHHRASKEGWATVSSARAHLSDDGADAWFGGSWVASAAGHM